jgi:hypothetical protein
MNNTLCLSAVVETSEAGSARHDTPVRLTSARNKLEDRDIGGFQIACLYKAISGLTVQPPQYADRQPWAIRLFRGPHYTHLRNLFLLQPESCTLGKGFVGNTTVSNELVPFRGEWMLYYGGADRVIGLATCGDEERSRM